MVEVFEQVIDFLDAIAPFAPPVFILFLLIREDEIKLPKIAITLTLGWSIWMMWGFNFRVVTLKNEKKVICEELLRQLEPKNRGDIPENYMPSECWYDPRDYE